MGGIQCQALWSPCPTHKKLIPQGTLTNEATEAQGGGLTAPKPHSSQGAHRRAEPTRATRGACPWCLCCLHHHWGMTPDGTPAPAKGFPLPCPSPDTPPHFHLVQRQATVIPEGSGPDTPHRQHRGSDRGNRANAQSPGGERCRCGPLQPRSRSQEGVVPSPSPRPASILAGGIVGRASSPHLPWLPRSVILSDLQYQCFNT